MSPAPRKKRVWTVSDFAQYAYSDASPQACRRARRFLQTLNTKHGGTLLIPSAGTNREYTLLPATLARLERDLFEAIETLEARLDAAEDAIDSVRTDQRDIVAQTRQNARDVAQLRRQRQKAA